MRVVGHLENEKEAYLFHSYLLKEDIPNLFESSKSDDKWIYNIWVHDEDHFERAREHFVEFTNNPTDKKFHRIKQAPIEETAEEMVTATKYQQVKERMLEQDSAKPRSIFLTKGLIFLCTFLFIFNVFQHMNLVGGDAGNDIPFTPIEEHLFYDFPLNQSSLIWPGFYEVMLGWPQTERDLAAPMFGDLKEGEVWRLITPIFLHAGVLHIIFNMMWLWLLGKQIEERVGILRYAALIIVIAIISNTSQYLMSGFSFLGFSGVICGLAGFIWVRQKLAPWEGYPLQRGTALFLLIFVLGITSLQAVAFFLNLFDVTEFSLNIANTAHVSGAIAGMLFAKIPIFSR